MLLFDCKPVVVDFRIFSTLVTQFSSVFKKMIFQSAFVSAEFRRNLNSNYVNIRFQDVETRFEANSLKLKRDVQFDFIAKRAFILT
jgi:hypothetical protein